MGLKPKKPRERKASRPADLPDQEGYQHGTRARYTAGCRCSLCRKANTAAYHSRREKATAAATALGTERTSTHCLGIDGEPCPNNTKLYKNAIGNVCRRCVDRLVWNGLVEADNARNHLLYLSRCGVGATAVRDTSGVAKTVITHIRTGKKQRIRAQTERAILSVTARDHADGALVSARGTWRRIKILREEHGYTKAAISKLIGQDGRALQLGKKQITAANARQILALFEMAEGAHSEEKHHDICTQCGHSHAPSNRQRLIARMYFNGLPSDEIKKAWSCFYSFDFTDEAAERRFYRDIAAIKARTK